LRRRLPDPAAGIGVHGVDVAGPVGYVDRPVQDRGSGGHVTVHCPFNCCAAMPTTVATVGTTNDSDNLTGIRNFGTAIRFLLAAMRLSFRGTDRNEVVRARSPADRV